MEKQLEGTPFNRYKVTKGPDNLRWAILDMHLWEYCTLPDDSDPEHFNLIPLEWERKEPADAWLRRCYSRWGRYPHLAPIDWKPKYEEGYQRGML